jgi:hypothetical protein
MNNKLNYLFKNEEPKKQQEAPKEKTPYTNVTKNDKEESKLTKMFDNKLEVVQPIKKHDWGKNKKFTKRNYEDDFPKL